MDQPLARLETSPTSFHVEAYEKIDYTLDVVDGVFDPANLALADCFSAAGRCLAVVDENVLALHGESMRAYFEHHGIDLVVEPVRIAETAKSLRTLEDIVDALSTFGLRRKEEVLVVGGGLTTDVAGFACASYKRTTGYVRIPTTLIGLIDASVSIKVGCNHGKMKNRLGAYHASSKVLLDSGFSSSLYYNGSIFVSGHSDEKPSRAVPHVLLLAPPDNPARQAAGLAASKVDSLARWAVGDVQSDEMPPRSRYIDLPPELRLRTDDL